MTAPPVATDAGTFKTLSRRQRYESLRAQLRTERSSFEPDWKDVSDFILPRRLRLFTSETNRQPRRSNKIIDSTATMSSRTLSSGMVSGITSPAREWKRLTVPDPEVAEVPAVKEWLHEVNQRMSTVFLRSNVYNVLPTLYADLGTFGTGAIAILEDDETVIRCQAFPVGSYYVANDEKNRVRVFVREFRLTVRQVVEQWGRGAYDRNGTRLDFSRISPTVQGLWRSGTLETGIDIVHAVQPNTAYDCAKFASQFKKFSSCYYEAGWASNDVFLAEEGFDEFPILVARWELTGNDAYGTNCPGMIALPDVKQLQQGEKLSAQAIEKMVKPPMFGPTSLKTGRVSTIAGDITYGDVRDGLQGFRPAYEVRFDVDKLESKQQQVRLRVQRAYFEDLFLMLSQSDRREITAREVDERHEEKLLALGPVLEQLDQDVLDPLIDRTFAIMQRRGLIPPAPAEIQGMALRVEYISIMAQAQKMVGLAILERFAAFVSQIATADPSALDNVDVDELIQVYADATGVPPKIIRAAAQVQQLRGARAQAQHQAAAAENAPKVADAAQRLSQTPTTGDSVLAQLIASANARRNLTATQQPVPAAA